MSYPNERDCHHGRKRGKCHDCDNEEEIADLKQELAEMKQMYADDMGSDTFDEEGWQKERPYT